MSLGAEDWLDVAPCHAARPDRAESAPVRLSDLPSDQRRELAVLGLAAVASCAFLLAPLVIADGARESVRELPSSALVVQFAPAPRVAAPSGLVSAPDASPSVGLRASAALSLKGDVAAVPVATTFTERDPERPGKRSVVARAIFGDGRHRVKPFPTPGN